MSLVALAERCEQATGPDRELDRGIQAVIDCYRYARRYTASLDAAIMLVPEGNFWVAMNAKDGVNDKPVVGAGLAIVAAPENAKAREPSEAATPALALCAAALRARSEEQ